MLKLALCIYPQAVSLLAARFAKDRELWRACTDLGLVKYKLDWSPR